MVPVAQCHEAVRKKRSWRSQPVLFLGVLLCCVWVPGWKSDVVFALSLEELDPERAWRVESVVLSGNTQFDAATLLAELQTKTRPWYTPWKKRPLFDPVSFERDLERVRHYYETQGYYQAQVTYDLPTDAATGSVSLAVRIKENEPVTVGALSVDVRTEAQTGVALPERLPLESGALFTEAAYVQTDQALRQVFLQHGHAWVEIERKAEVDLNTRQARVAYSISPGPPTIFGTTHVDGTRKVDPQIVLRELTYASGELFSLAAIEQSRQNLLSLDLFHSIHMEFQQETEKPRQVPIRIRVAEKEPRSIRLGAGYSTDEEFIGLAAWQHRNWLGGGRRLSAELRLSAIQRSIGATFVQPSFLTHDTALHIDAKQGQEDEDTYLLNYSRLRPRIERHFSPTFSGFVDYRIEFLKFNEVGSSTVRALEGLRREGVLSGPTLGLVWDTTEDLLNPTQGGMLSVVANQAGTVWGGDYKFFSLTAEAKHYQRLGWGVVLATRLKTGLSDFFGSQRNIPLSERFYAGGDGGVRGYGRRKLGALNEADDPLGGLSVIEGSIELRRPLWRELAGTVFLDFGQLSLESYDIPVDSLQFAPGFGLSYATRIGPLRFDIGFPIDPADDDEPWRVHFGIGQSF